MYHYYMFNKPFGCVTARRDNRYPTVMDYFRELHNDSLSPVGRLDRETEGLLFITDDGVWNQEMTHPGYQKKKTYEFTALGCLTENKIRELEEGVLLKGSPVPTAPAEVTVTHTTRLGDILPTLHPEIQEKTKHNRMDHPVVKGRITITEGRKRQIRRMMKTVGCCVIELKRISIDSLQLDPDLKPGQWKELSPLSLSIKSTAPNAH
ncbi:MAG: pseudouridine synthase [Lachnoclostridium sp.]|nr:pseudouridine synthase [Lachnoclostridium sp.]